MNRRSFLSVTGSATALVRTDTTRAGDIAGRKARSRFRQTCEDARWNATGADHASDAAIFQAAWRRSHLRLSARPGREGAWTADELKRTRDLCEQHGVALDMVALPFLTSSHIDRENRGAIMLGESPERDRDIEDIQKMIEACAEAGIPAFKYNMSLLGVLRTGTTPGRGGTRYSTWRLAEAREIRRSRGPDVSEEPPGSGSRISSTA